MKKSSRPQKSIWALLLIFTVAAACTLFGADFSEAEPTTPAETAIPINSTVPDEWYAVYFTEPGLEGYRGGPDSHLIEAIENAKLSIDIAVYDLNLWGIRDALREAHQRGVKVRMVTETNYLDNPETQELIAAGIPVIDDNNNGLMHNKFVIIDRNQVWTGSMNLTINGAYRNDNNLIMLNNRSAAEAFGAEFEEMFSNRQFGSYSPKGAGVDFLIKEYPSRDLLFPR